MILSHLYRFYKHITVRPMRFPTRSIGAKKDVNSIICVHISSRVTTSIYWSSDYVPSRSGLLTYCAIFLFPSFIYLGPPFLESYLCKRLSHSELSGRAWCLWTHTYMYSSLIICNQFLHHLAWIQSGWFADIAALGDFNICHFFLVSGINLSQHVALRKPPKQFPQQNNPDSMRDI